MEKEKGMEREMYATEPDDGTVGKSVANSLVSGVEVRRQTLEQAKAELRAAEIRVRDAETKLKEGLDMLAAIVAKAPRDALKTNA